jgi:signal peptidase I
MTPTIQPGDLILVEKISPIIRRDIFKMSPASKLFVMFGVNDIIICMLYFVRFLNETDIL